MDYHTGPCQRTSGTVCPNVLTCHGLNNPAICDLLTKRQAWAALTDDERSEQMNVQHHTIQRTLPLVKSCPDRGTTLPASVSEACGCAELTVCGQLKGRYPGRVTLRDCLACQGVAFETAGS